MLTQAIYTESSELFYILMRLQGERTMRMKGIVSWVVFTFLLVSSLALTLRVKPAWAIGEPVYINSDGSVSPEGLISSLDNVTYTLSSNISSPDYFGIVVERSDIVIDGDGRTVRGNLSGNGLDLTGMSNITVKNMNVKSFRCGINLSSSNNNRVIGNNVTANNATGISLYSSSNNMIIGNNLTSNRYYGITLTSSNNNTVNGCNASANDYGIVVVFSDNNTISGNTVTANTPQHGIFFNSSNNNTISGNSVTSNGQYGIWITNSSSNNTVSGNNIKNNQWGLDIRTGSNNNRVVGNNVTANTVLDIQFYYSSNHVVVGNNVTGSPKGISLYSSLNNVMYHNNFIGNSAHVYVDAASLGNAWNGTHPSGGNYWSNYTGVDLYWGANQDLLGSDGIGDTNHAIDANNRDYFPLMNPYVSFEGQTIYIRSNGSVDPSGAPVLREGDSYTITGNISSDSDGIVIERSNMTLDGAGLTVQGSLVGKGLNLTSISNVTVQNINVNSFEYGMYLRYVSSCFVTGNNVTSNNSTGIYLINSPSNMIIGNNVASNIHGIYLYSSNNNTIIGNNATANDSYGIRLCYSSCYNTVIENNVTANTGPPGGGGGAGILLYVDSNNNRIIGNNLTSNRDYGLMLQWSSNNTVSGNSIKNSQHCALAMIYQSGNNSVIGNTITSSNRGVGLDNSSSNNVMYHNNFVNNTIHAYVYAGSLGNAWNDTYPSGGNYWSNYTGVDLYGGIYQNETGSDGIGDTPHTIDAMNIDYYPLMKSYGGTHDIGVTNVTNSKTGCVPKPTVGQGYNVSITVTILNYGMDAESFNLTIYANATAIQTITGIIIASRNTTMITFTWNTTGFTKGNYTITAYAEPVLDEEDATDNSLIDGTICLVIVGDVNGDGKVELKDVYAVARAYGTSVEGPNPPGRTYSPNCDINDDGKIDMKDYYQVCKHYGEVDP